MKRIRIKHCNNIGSSSKTNYYNDKSIEENAKHIQYVILYSRISFQWFCTAFVFVRAV